MLRAGSLGHGAAFIAQPFDAGEFCLLLRRILQTQSEAHPPP